MAQDEQVDRADAEHHQRMAVEAIGDPAPARQCQIFAHGQRVDVADAAAIEIARRGVVDAVRVPPEIIRRQRQHADHASDPIVRQAMTKERAMAAIVLDHEQADEKTRGRNGKQQIKPVAEMIDEPHRQPKQNKWYDCNQNLDDAAAVVRLTKARQTLRQGAQIGRSGARIGVRSVVQKFSPAARSVESWLRVVRISVRNFPRGRRLFYAARAQQSNCRSTRSLSGDLAPACVTTPSFADKRLILDKYNPAGRAGW